MPLPKATPQTLGKALRLTPQQTRDSAHISPIDLLNAKRLWQQHAPARMKTLLDARLVSR